MTLAFVMPGLDEAASEKAIAILQNRLSQEQEAALVLKHAHWNVTGPNFIAVHEMLDPAEGRVGTEEYLKALIEYYDAFIADDRKAIAELDELDVISSNVIQDHVQQLEKFQWFMRSHLA